MAGKRRGRWDWLKKPLATRQEESRWVKSQLHSLSHATENGTISSQILPRFQEITGLADFTWRVYYHRRPGGRVQTETDLVANAQGYVVFMHGWDGSHAIWEDLPMQVCQANPRLVCFALDVNGFGGSPLLELCGPRGNMEAVELWLDLLKIHRPGGQRQIFTFVGHSMSGASVFHKAKRGWDKTRYSLLALAPAMLHKDTVKKAFYQTLGLGIGAGVQYGFLDSFKGRLAVLVMDILAANASQAVKDEHVRIFQRTGCHGRI